MSIRIEFADIAKSQIQSLPKDKVLLKAIWNHFEYVGEDPHSRTEAPIPMLQRLDRRRIEMDVYTTSGELYHLTVLCAVETERLYITSVNFGLSQSSSDSDF